MMISLQTPIASAPKISTRIVPSLKRLGIRTIRDLLFHFPARYDDFSNTKNISDISEDETVTVRCAVLSMSSRTTARKKMHLTQAVVADETGAMQILWFNQPFLARNFSPGTELWLSGKAVRGPRGLCFQNPAHEKVPMRETLRASRGIHTGRLVPVYPETGGISSRWLRFLMNSFLPLARAVADPLPEETRKKYGLAEIREAIGEIHFPRTPASAAAAERRFMFEELLLIQLRAMRERARLKQHTAPPIPLDVAIMKKFVLSLPFSLTDAQRRSLYEIGRDMAQSHPMNRLLEGDVGSGKTVVAAASSLLAVRAGYRVAFMAPTEILARQHFATMSRILEPFHLSIGLLTGSEKKVKGAPDITVGTQALIQKSVRLENLGLVVVDEQHRFGVSQRGALLRNKELGIKNYEDNPDPLIPNSSFLIPHFLSMTATPIPRTLALTAYGDLDLSLLDEMPESRKNVITKIIVPEERNGAYQFIREEVRRGRQVFVVCPRIEVGSRLPAEASAQAGKSEVGGGISRHSIQQKLLLAEVKTVKEEFRKLSEEVFPDLRIAMLHGKMKTKEKDGVMRGFHDRETDIMVSTSVIEIGIDVPNATVIMIEGAERFGLAQLHQFRGRVGRGADQSYCFLFPTEDGLASRRLKAVVDAKNGFELAEYDLKIRGPGDLFGTEQWGQAGMAIRGITNPEMVREVRMAAAEIAQQSPDLSAYPLLLERLQEMEKTLHLE